MRSHISASEAYEIYQKNPNVVLVDVRTLSEYQSMHVRNALHIDIYMPNFQERIRALDRNKKYFLYCASGARSAYAAQMMRQMNFPDAYNVGGIGELLHVGFPYETA
ncbi:MAG: rhodanese-like domain-containing protein [Bacteroidia bacterium]